MQGAQAILKVLTEHEVTEVFGYPGGAIMPLYDALLDSPVKHYLCRHEQGAAFAAIGYARATNSPGVCIATSGPGATNLLTSLADAKLDSVPLVVITGQVARQAMGSDAFQEVDVLGLSLSISKHSIQVTEPEELVPALQEAFFISQDGRPGPVLVDIPKDIQLGEVPDWQQATHFETCTGVPSTSDIDAINQMMAGSERPVLYIGGGVGMAEAEFEFRDFAQRCQYPTVSTLKALGTADNNSDSYLGMLGMHGLAAANLAVQECDCLIAIGARLDDRVTGKLDEFAPEAKLIHLDIDPAEIHKRRQADVSLLGDLKHILPQLQGRVPSAWRNRISQLKKDKSVHYPHPTTGQIDAPSLLRRLSDLSGINKVVSCDVGQHQMWVAQHMQFDSPTCHLSSGGLGTMGFGLPAAIGAKVARPNDQVIAVCGDGSFMMNVQELGTLRRYQIPVKIVVLDNQRLGMVKQWQELFHEERYSETDLSDNPEFSRLAAAFDIASDVIDDAADLDAALQKMLDYPGPYLLHVRLDSKANVWPIVPPNTANHLMWEEAK